MKVVGMIRACFDLGVGFHLANFAHFNYGRCCAVANSYAVRDDDAYVFRGFREFSVFQVSVVWAIAGLSVSRCWEEA